jgi:archaellum biogenesis ATPase FlaH
MTLSDIMTQSVVCSAALPKSITQFTFGRLMNGNNIIRMTAAFMWVSFISLNQQQNVHYVQSEDTFKGFIERAATSPVSPAS